MDSANFEDELWCASRRDDVVAYLATERLDHGEVGEVPAWFITPVLSIWAVESLKNPGWLGWWVICGDVPTDYCSSQDCPHPRLATKRIAEHWRTEIARTRQGDLQIGRTGLSVDLIDLLAARAEMLLTLAEDNAIWPE